MIADIQAALDGRFALLSGEKAFPGVAYNPTVGVPYLAAQMAVRGSDHLGVGPGVPRWWRGTYQILVSYPTGEGLGPAHEAAEAVMAQFKRGLLLTSGDARVTIERTTAVQPYPTADWINVPVLVEWFCEEQP